jgi:uncharacterized protein with PIN domain
VADSAPRFLVDEMLQRLGRWLRAAGYDTLIAGDSESDYYLFRRALDDGRYLITRDRKLSEYRRAEGTVILLESERMEDNARELAEHIPINWHLAPFTRCMVCNTPLVDATPEQRIQIPAKSRDTIDAAFYCPQCRQVFWEGSHVKRMRHHLDDWFDKYTRGSIATTP